MQYVGPAPTDCLNPVELAGPWREICLLQRQISARPLRGQGHHGPALAIADALVHLGWVMLSPTMIQMDCDRGTVNMQECSPGMMQWCFVAAYERRVDRDNAIYLRHRPGSRAGTEHVRKEHWDWTTIRQVLRTKRTTNQEKAILLQLICGTLPTREWLAAHGFAVENKCECGAVDSLAHRFEECPVRTHICFPERRRTAVEVRSALLRPNIPEKECRMRSCVATGRSLTVPLLKYVHVISHGGRASVCTRMGQWNTRMWRSWLPVRQRHTSWLTGKRDG